MTTTESMPVPATEQSPQIVDAYRRPTFKQVAVISGLGMLVATGLTSVAGASNEGVNPDASAEVALPQAESANVLVNNVEAVGNGADQAASQGEQARSESELQDEALAAVGLTREDVTFVGLNDKINSPVEASEASMNLGKSHDLAEAGMFTPATSIELSRQILSGNHGDARALTGVKTMLDAGYTVEQIREFAETGKIEGSSITVFHLNADSAEVKDTPYVDENGVQYDESRMVGANDYFMVLHIDGKTFESRLDCGALLQGGKPVVEKEATPAPAPEAPTKPEAPAKPGKPEAPKAPTKPEAPAKPGKPEAPKAPTPPKETTPPSETTTPPTTPETTTPPTTPPTTPETTTPETTTPETTTPETTTPETTTPETTTPETTTPETTTPETTTPETTTPETTTPETTTPETTTPETTVPPSTTPPPTHTPGTDPPSGVTQPGTEVGGTPGYESGNAETVTEQQDSEEPGGMDPTNNGTPALEGAPSDEGATNENTNNTSESDEASNEVTNDTVGAGELESDPAMQGIAANGLARMHFRMQEMQEQLRIQKLGNQLNNGIGELEDELLSV